MSLDAALLALCANELKTALADTRIDKIYQPTRDEVVISLHSRSQNFKLLLSARVGSARVCLTNANYENPATPPGFCMLLRKHLGGGRLQNVRNVQGDRIVFFDFLCTNEMGDLVQNTLTAELMGRYCNLVLMRYNEDGTYKVLDALKRISFEDSEIRQLLPGLKYTLPALPNKLDFITAPVGKITEATTQSEQNIGEALRKVVGGAGPVVMREVCHRAFGGQDLPARQMSAAQKNTLAQTITDIRDIFSAGGMPCAVHTKQGDAIEFSFIPLAQYTPECELIEYTGTTPYSNMLEGYYADKDKAERLRQKSKVLRKTVAGLYERAQRKQAARTQDLADSTQSEELRIKGELITANLHAMQKGDKAAGLHNWYTGEDIDIALDVRLTPSQNAQKYFKEYKRKQTAAQKLEQLLYEGKAEIEWLQSVLYEIDTAEGDTQLNEVRAELKAQGYLKYYKQRDKTSKPADFYRYTSQDGFLILAGRNNTQNEKLTLKTARGKDLWFHVKNAPGSHVVVISEGKDIPLPTQNQAAMLAVWHSSQKNGAKVPVDYTEVKNIRKTKDLPPGMVLYEHYETAYVTVDEEIIKNLVRDEN